MQSEGLTDYSANRLLPTLLGVSGDKEMPTLLRTSSLTLLATCFKASSVATLPYVAAAAETCITLLQTESKTLQQDDKQTKSASNTSTGLKSREEETPAPLSNDTPHPALRRAAVTTLCKSLVIKPQRLTVESQRRARMILSYVADQDTDALVRERVRTCLADEEVADVLSAVA